MTIDTTIEAGLPALAWLVECEGNRMRARCGTGVEISEHGLCEGCWAGDFPAFDFDRADYVFGTGVSTRGDNPVFVPPSHTLDALFVWDRQSGYSVSNSLAFLCEHCRIELPYSNYGARLASVVLGIDRYEKRIHRSPKGVLYRIVYDRFSIDEAGFHFTRPTSNFSFADFSTYRAHLIDVMRRTADNAAHPLRKKQFELLATCSSGYDSATGAALALEIGCSEAITFKTARSGISDSGREIGEALGITVFELPGHENAWTLRLLPRWSFAPAVWVARMSYSLRRSHFSVTAC